VGLILVLGCSGKVVTLDSGAVVTEAGNSGIVVTEAGNSGIVVTEAGNSGIIVEAGTKDAGPSSLCQPISPCGGSVVGTWSMTALCTSFLEILRTADACIAEAEKERLGARISSVNATLTFTFDTYVPRGSVTTSITREYTAACLAALGSPPPSESSCPSIESWYRNATCSFAGGRCICVSSNATPFLGGGTYRVEGNEILFGNDSRRSPYCVDGDTLSIGSPDDYDAQTFERVISP
jgi:hypothetical protein